MKVLLLKLFDSSNVVSRGPFCFRALIVYIRREEGLKYSSQGVKKKKKE